MLAHITSAALIGVSTEIVLVETYISNGFPSFTIVGLPDAAVQEARERLRAAIRNSDLEFPGTRRITVNLAPAHLRKIGASYDVPIAISILSAQHKLERMCRDHLFIGELGLDGMVRPCRGVLAITQAAKRAGLKGIFVPQENAAEASLVPDIAVYGVHRLRDLFAHLQGRQALSVCPTYTMPDDVEGSAHSSSPTDDFAFIRGQQHGKRALEIAAAGGHHVFLYGPPGTGKTMLAHALQTILPPPDRTEALEITTVASAYGVIRNDAPLLYSRPVRAPHHSASPAAILGGGTPIKAGEITLAHRGVLILDELPEFSRTVLEGLREPLERGEICISRAHGALTLPARFLLVATMNPCPCGFYKDPFTSCTCAPQTIIHYQKKISGPLLDRMDVSVAIPKIDAEIMSEALQTELPADDNNSPTRPASIPTGERSVTIRARVISARQRQRNRYGDATTNAELSQAHLEKYCLLSHEANAFLKTAAEKLHLSARSFFKIVKVGLTIADLEASPITPAHLAEALQYRKTERA